MRPADVVEAVRSDLVDVLPRRVEEAELVHHAERSAFTRRTVVGQHHQHRVVEQAAPLEEVGQPADLRVGVLEHRRERLLQPRRERPLVVGEVVPRGHTRVGRRERRVGRNDAHLDLAGEPAIAGRVVPVRGTCRATSCGIRAALDAGVRRAEREVQEERTVGPDRLQVADPTGRLVDDVFGDVVPVLGTAGRVDVAVVAREFRVELVGFACKNP